LSKDSALASLRDEFEDKLREAIAGLRDEFKSAHIHLAREMVQFRAEMNETRAFGRQIMITLIRNGRTAGYNDNKAVDELRADVRELHDGLLALKDRASGLVDVSDVLPDWENGG
jgi:hypothetical protein